MSGGRLVVDALAEAAKQGANGRLPQMGPGLFTKNPNRAPVVEGLAVGAVGDEDVVRVGHRQNPCFEWNLLAAQSPRITAAIDALVVSDDDVGLAVPARGPAQK